MELSKPIKELYLVGPAYVQRLKKLGIKTVGDFLYHFPFRYIDYSLASTINRVQPGETVSVKGRVILIENQYTLRGKKIQKAKIQDKTGIIEAVWFNQPFLIKTLKSGTVVSLSGKADFWNKKLALISPEYEILKGKEQIHTGRLVPVYHETYGVSSKWIRSRMAPLINSVKNQLKEFLPAAIINKHDLISLDSALKQIHFPQNLKEAQSAQQRFAFEEFFLIQLAALQRKKGWQKRKAARAFLIDQKKILTFTNQLPFKLTPAQNRVLKEILADLTKNQPMNRLLQGDVGSGKTVIAAMTAFTAFLNNMQSALMAPTEILAHQHFQTLNQLLASWKLKISLLTGSSKKSTTDFDLIVGTHALIEKRAVFKNLGLVVIDEQHRFGVEQRSKLIKKGKVPHVLIMTATPIPRTIALTLYGDLDLSVLNQMPPGRSPVKTWIVPPQKRIAACEWIKKRVKNTSEQAFIVCPLIEESETLQTVRAASAEYQRLKTSVFSDLKLGLLHGRMKAKDKQEVISQFRQGKLDILITTPVVEVGIDIPQATIMMIEGADRFGLAQLHQLRGRIGRGSKKSYCLLFSDIGRGKSFQRLKFLEKTHQGMELAEIDLQMRGPGEVYGTSQHGFPQLKLASFSDLALIEKTRQAASEIIGKINQYPLLKERLKQDTIRTVEPN